jgi:CrcB protein
MGIVGAIAAGGAVGSVLRYYLGRWNGALETGALPWGTLAANVLGCLAIGLLGALFATTWTSVRPEIRMGILVGVLGGFTTFSSFGFETLQLLQAGHGSRALLYVVLSNGLGLAAAWAGYRIATSLTAT